MGNLFRPDGKAFAVLDRITDYAVLSLLWLVCCVPLVTIGAATSALYTITLRWQQQQDVSLFRDFFRAFRCNFKPGLVLSVLLLVAVLVLGTDGYLLAVGAVPGGRPVLFLLCALAMLVLMAASYVFALLAFFDDPVRALVRNAVLMSLRYFPRTVLLLLTSFGPLAAALACYQTTHLLLYLCVVFAPAVCARANAFILYPVFQKHLPDVLEEPG